MKELYPAHPGTVIADKSADGTMYFHLSCFVGSTGVRQAMKLTTGMQTRTGHWICETYLYQPATCAHCSERIEVRK